MKQVVESLAFLDDGGMSRKRDLAQILDIIEKEISFRSGTRGSAFFQWQGSMMSQATRDPRFWATIDGIGPRFDLDRGKTEYHRQLLRAAEKGFPNKKHTLLEDLDVRLWNRL